MGFYNKNIWHKKTILSPVPFFSGRGTIGGAIYWLTAQNIYKEQEETSYTTSKHKAVTIPY